MRTSLSCLVLLALFTACGPTPEEPRNDVPNEKEQEPEEDPVVEDFIAGGDRPVNVHVPEIYDPDVPAPLVMFLHGYGFSGDFYENAMNITATSDARGFIYLYPDGTVDQDAKVFWNATSACCNFFGSTVDDSAYLRGLLEEVADTVNIDSARVYVMGHSNGAFMANRLACDHADLIAGIVSISGTAPASCEPSEPVSVMQVHGTVDGTIDYNGGFIAAAYLSARASTEQWAGLGGCSLTPRVEDEPRDVDVGVAGAETIVDVYDDGCTPGGHAELWTVEGAGHILQTSATFVDDAVDFLMNHPKP